MWDAMGFTELKRKNKMPYLVGGTGDKKSNGGQQYYFQHRIYKAEDLALSIATINPYYYLRSEKMKDYRIRKLTPRECWRLMDFTDEDFDKAEEVNSNTQLYKQAGNSIVVNCLVAILGQLFDGKEEVYKNR